nr:MAG TPA: hypothetical protein [Caudoviricetes sp.]
MLLIKYYQSHARYDKPPICLRLNIISTIQPNKTLGLPNKTLATYQPEQNPVYVRLFIKPV